MKKDIELLVELTIESIVMQQHLVMLLEQAGMLQPPLREPVISRLERYAEALDAVTSADFPHEIPRDLKRTALLLRGQQRSGEN